MKRIERRPGKVNVKRLNYIRSIIEKDIDPVVIGTIHGTAFVNDNVIMGERVTIGPMSCIGWYGLGAEWDEDGHIIRFPQFGKVEIRDDVFILAGVHIDASTNDERNTIIGERTILGPKAHICHNVNVGNDCAIMGDAILCGSVTTGDRCIIGANCTVRNKVTLGNDVIIGMGAVVTKDVPDSTVVKGNPGIWKSFK